MKNFSCAALAENFIELINQQFLTLDSKSTFSFTERVWNDANSEKVVIADQTRDDGVVVFNIL